MRRTRSVWKVIPAVLATLVVVLAMLWLSGTFRPGKVRPGDGQVVSDQRVVPATMPKLAPVQLHTRPHFAELVGSVQAEYRSSITSRLMANILEVRVRAGDRVKAGDVLVVLDDRNLQARVAQARESLRGAIARRDLLKSELDRITKLYAEKVATAFELEQAQSRYASAAAEAASGEEAVRESEVALSDAQLKSPIDGIVIDRLAEPGDQASSGRPLLNLYSPQRLRLEASVREAYVGRLKRGDSVPVFIDALRQERAAEVEEIVPASDPQSRSFLVKLKIANPDGLYPGMFGRVRLPLDPQKRLEIPASAVEQVGQVSLVQAWVDGRPQRRAVRLGRAAESHVEVLAGLAEGEQVVLP